MLGEAEDFSSKTRRNDTFDASGIVNLTLFASEPPPKIDAQQLADSYLADVLGPEFSASNGFFGDESWYFLIRYRKDAVTEPSGIGAKLVVDTQHQAVVPLTDEQIQDFAEVPKVQQAQSCGELARDQNGYVLRYQAKRNATVICAIICL